jgi:basic amino acid/polyamine antiporter, APA family
LKHRKIGIGAAFSVIVSSMLGSGVFTSLGFQALGIQSVAALLSLWIVGGTVALCGAYSYAELAVRYPHSGGEYNFLTKIFHPAIGFLSGWVSSTVGFAVPAAMSAMAMANYLSTIYPQINTTAFASIILISSAILNLQSIKLGSRFQVSITAINLGLMLCIILAAFILVDKSANPLTFDLASFKPIFTDSFATSLVYVSFAYSGWNAITYIINDVDNQQVTVPRALSLGSITVMALYVAVNFAFLYSTPIDVLAGKLQIGQLAGTYIFGETGGNIITVIICIVLLASVNAMMMTGPRVAQAIGHNLTPLKVFSTENSKGTPWFATLFQLIIALCLVLTSSFEVVFTYIGFTLSLFTTLTVIGLLYVRFKNKKTVSELSYKTPLFPIPPIIFIGVELWMLYYLAADRPLESFFGFLTVLSGLIIYFIVLY